MTTRTTSRVLAVCALCAVIAGTTQGQVISTTGSIIFGTQFTEAVVSGIAGTQAAPNLQVGALDSTAIHIAIPSVGGPGDAAELTNFGGLAAQFGDADNDGVHVESQDFGGALDAVWVPGGLSTPPSLCDAFVSLQADTGSGGIFGGVPVLETEMIRIQPAGAPLKLYTEADLEILLGIAPGGLVTHDVDAFAKDLTTGDLYLSFTATVAAGGFSILDGDVVVIPGTAYTPLGTVGVVSAPVGGLAFIGAREADFQAILTALGVTAPTNFELSSLDLDPAGGAWTSSAATIPNLLFTIETTGATTGATAPSIYTTQTGGAFAVVNSVTMNAAPAIGMNVSAFNNTFLAGSLDALDVVTQVPTRLPLTIDRFPNVPTTTNPITTPGVLSYSVAGINPGSAAYIAVNTGPLGPGAAATRIPSLSFGLPGYCEFYIDLFTPDFLFSFFAYDPIGSTLIAPNPVPNSTAPGYGSFQVTIPIAVPAGFTIVLQAVDLSDLTLSPGNELRF